LGGAILWPHPVLIFRDLGGAAVAEPPSRCVGGVFRSGNFHASSAQGCIGSVPHGHHWAAAAARRRANPGRRLDQPKCRISQSSSNSISDTHAIDSLNPALGSSTFTPQPSLQMQFRKFFRVSAMGCTRAVCNLIHEWNQRAKKACFA
jgi:hypothetical protein